MQPKSRTLLLFAAAAGLMVLPFAFAKAKLPAPVVQTPDKPAPDVPLAPPAADAPKIQIALLLDTSSSMDGLIAQAKSQLWKIVNEFAAAKRDGKRPQLEIALYEYGKSTLNPENGWVRMILPLTGDLDRVSEELFALTTNGGEEYAGRVIRTAVNELKWSEGKGDLRLIFIAGNEAFTQGDVPYADAIRSASKKGITVNTIFCGPRDEGINTGWQAGALLADGRFLSIDHDAAVVHIPAPQDEEIARLGMKINETYIPYGAEGWNGMQRQSAQDSNAVGSAEGSMMQRALSKASYAYSNATWDLVDAIRDRRVRIEDVKAEELPESLRKLSPADRRAHVEAKLKERAEIQKRIAELNAARTTFVEAEMKKLGQNQTETLDKAMIAAVRDQGTKNGFTW
jgi:hypothetical protein